MRLGATPEVCPPDPPIWLSRHEQSRWKDLGELRKPVFLGSRVLLRGLLADAMGGEPAEWSLGARGNPVAPAVELCTSISHQACRAAVAFCAGTAGLGIDLERPRRQCDWHQIARRWFAPAEQALLRDAGDAAESLFYRLWTLKEAWVKATGRGLAGNFQAIQAQAIPSMETRGYGPDGDAGLRILGDVGEQGWQGWSGWTGQEWLAVIWRGADGPPAFEVAEVVADCCIAVRPLTPTDALQFPITPLGETRG